MFLRHDSEKSLDFMASVGFKLGMYHLLDRFRKPPRRAMDLHDATPIRDEQAIRLPTELLILIASYIQNRGDLANLCIVSKTFRNVAAPMLYRTIEIGRRGQGSASGGDITAGHLLLYRTLQDTHFSQAVREVYLTLKSNQICTKHIPSTAKRRSSSLRHCSCEAYDQTLGKALLCLNNLEILDLQCELCPGQHFHNYLLLLDVPRLKGVRFRCASSRNEQILLDSDSILLAPFMRNITALGLDCHFEWWLCRNPIWYKQFLKDAEVLPNLRAIVHNRCKLTNDLLTARSIERIWFNQISEEDSLLLQKSIRISPGTLSHLLSVNILEWLPRSMAQDLEPYRYLRYIGTIGLPQLEEVTALNAISVFIPLKHLETMEINRIPKPQDEDQPIRPFQYIFSPSPSFFDLLGLQHPALHRVLLISRQYQTPGFPRDVPPVLWEHHGGWDRRIISSFCYWDVLDGKLDNV